MDLALRQTNSDNLPFLTYTEISYSRHVRVSPPAQKYSLRHGESNRDLDRTLAVRRFGHYMPSTQVRERESVYICVIASRYECVINDIHMITTPESYLSGVRAKLHAIPVVTI